MSASRAFLASSRLRPHRSCVLALKLSLSLPCPLASLLGLLAPCKPARPVLGKSQPRPLFAMSPRAHALC